MPSVYVRLLPGARMKARLTHPWLGIWGDVWGGGEERLLVCPMQRLE